VTEDRLHRLAEDCLEYDVVPSIAHYSHLFCQLRKSASVTGARLAGTTAPHFLAVLDLRTIEPTSRTADPQRAYWGQGG
jgi:hypothetical protein